MTADGGREASPAPVPAARGAAGVLIETKLYAPAPRPEWLERAGLVRYLAGATGKLILVGAPAGFGKSILVAQWRCSPAEGRRFGWVSLDPGDDDPGRLWWHLVCALQRACPRFDGEPVLRALHVQVPDFEATVLPMLANALAALAEPVVIVLDDYHVIRRAAATIRSRPCSCTCRPRPRWRSSPAPIPCCRCTGTVRPAR